MNEQMREWNEPFRVSVVLREEETPEGEILELYAYTPENQGCLQCAIALVKGIQVQSLLSKWHIIQEADLSNTS